MKKFFGLIVLLAAVIFSSCSFNNTRKKGSVDFSIPIGEIIALRNEIAEEEVIEKEYDENQEEIEYESEYKELYSFLVQIKGDKGYHEIRYEYLDDVTKEDLDNENTKFHFSFDNLPANQIYKVMIDVYYEEKHIGHEEERSHALLIYSGDKDNIIVFPGEITRETLVLEETDSYSYSNFNVVVEYKDGDSEKSQTIDLKAPENIPAAFTRYEQIDDNDVTTYTYYFKEFTKENPKTEEDDSAMYWGYEDQDPEKWYEITDLSFQLREDSHFWGFDFKQPRDVYTEGADEPERVEISLEFDEDGICPVYEYLNGESHLFNYPLSAELKAETATISTSMWAPIIIFSKITFKEKEPEKEPVEEKTLTLSIPGIELKESGLSDSDGASDLMYTYLVQVRSISDNKYYAAETKTVNGEALKETQVFKFTGFDSGMNYNAMVDIFSMAGNPLLEYAGDEKFVISGDTTSVEVIAAPTSVYSYSDFYLSLSYEKDGSTIPYTDLLDESPEDFSVMFAKCMVETTNGEEYKYYFRQKKTDDEEIPTFGFEDENPEDWFEITDIRFGIKEASHFRKFSFVQPVSTGDEMSEIELKFDDNGLFEVTEYLEGNSYIFNYPLSATLTFDEESTFEASLLTPQVRFANITFAEKETPKEETFTDTQSGEITIHESKLSFEPWNVQEDQPVRYISTVSLADILGDKKLSNDDTVVFVLKTEDEGKENLFNQYNVSQFYYQLQEDDWKTIYADDGTGLYKNNNCINFTPKTEGAYSFIMPLNFVKDPEDYKNLQLFFDCPKDTTAASLELECTVNYYIFPASTKTFVFGLGQNWSGDTEAYPFRYELDLPLTDSLEEGQTVSVQLRGTLNHYSADDDISSPKLFKPLFDFTGEIYDGACYEVADSYKPDNNSYYHPLSQKSTDGNVKNLEIVNGEFSGDGEFLFASIQAPFYDRKDESENPEHNYRFQCYISCSDAEKEKILVIKGFEIIIN